MATQVPIANTQSIVCAAMQATPTCRSGKSAGPAAPENPAPRLFAQMVEFVALPGKAECLQTEIPLALKQANGGSEGFAGCIVMFSEQERRLVTLVTLWRDGSHTNESNGTFERLKALLEPYVDSWLRTRSFHTFVSLAQ